jgi:nitrite reductase (NADH) small subunit
MARWTRTCLFEDIPCPGAHVLRREEAPDVAVFRTEDDRLFALIDRCPHRGARLSQGFISGERIACPLHQTTIDMESGNALAPDKGCVQTFAVKVERGIVYVELQPDDTRASAMRSWQADRSGRMR